MIKKLFSKIILIFKLDLILDILSSMDYRYLINIKKYKIIKFEDVFQKRKSDTVFIFGSGTSINELNEDDVKLFKNHDTVAFNWFLHNTKISLDFYIIRGIQSPQNLVKKNDRKKEYKLYKTLLDRNSNNYKNCTFLLQSGLRGTDSRRSISKKLLPKTAQLAWYKVERNKLINQENSNSLIIQISTLLTALSFANLGKWKKIVLVGVDLYDRNYFWNPLCTRQLDISRGAKFSDLHSTTNRIIPAIETWAKYLNKSDRKLMIYNKNSMLNQILPVYQN